MSIVTVDQASIDLSRLIDEASTSHKPILIAGKRNNAVLLSEEDWSALQETLYLTSIPRMAASIKKGMKTPISKCSKKLN